MMTYCQLAKNFPCQEFADGYPTLDEGTRKGRCFAITTDLNIVLYIYIYNDWFIGSLYSPFKIVPFVTKGKYNLTFHSVRFACFSSWNNTLWDLCRSPISMLHYPRSHWFESFLEPHNSFLLSLGSATSKTFVFNLPLIPLNKKKKMTSVSISASWWNKLNVSSP